MAANSEPNALPVVETISPCLHLRNKGMYIYTDGTGNEDDDDDGGTNYWCMKTMKCFGPDDDLVGGRLCRDSSRTCYEPI
jgi:hypothetical protein